MGLIADEQLAMYQVLQAAELTHSKGMQSYLCMMAVRLVDMRRMLKDTGRRTFRLRREGNICPTG